MSTSLIITFILASVVAYLICGLNPAIVLSKLVYKKDIRNEGSGNPGFTNFKRVFGMKLAWLVFLLDFSKAIIIELIAGLIFSNLFGNEYRIPGISFTGIFAVLGHSFPIWYGFKGGKSFLVGLSTLFLIDWRVGLLGFAILCLFLFTTHFMSLSSLLCLIGSIPLLVIFHADWLTLVCFSICTLIIVIRHKENIKRLFTGKETKFFFGSKK